MNPFVWIASAVILGQSLAGSIFEECTKENTYGYEYLTYFPVEMIKKSENVSTKTAFYIEFHVKASRDAHVLLAPKEAREGYEILLGGGNNSFSQIRIVGGGRVSTKFSKETKGVISSVDYKGFWVKLGTVGLITVGELGQEEPFLFWMNMKPFKVNFFAFSSWTNVKGVWFFNCASEPKSDANQTAVQKLKSDLLTLYNPNSFPAKVGDSTPTVQVNLEASYFHLDEKRGELLLSGLSYLKWMDPKLVWNSSDYEDIPAMYLTPYQVWTPNVRVINSLSFEKRSLLTLGGGVAVNSNGEVTWRTPFRSVTFCSLGYRKWPFDQHNCSLKYGFLTEPLIIDVQRVDISKLSKSEWEIKRMEGKSGESGQSSVIDIQFRRQNPSFRHLLLPPFLAGAVLCLLSFWISPTSLAKLFLNCGSVVVLVLTLLSLGERLPTMLTSLPEIVLLYSWGVLVMCIPVVLFVGFKYFPSAITLPRLSSEFLRSNIVEVLLCFPQKPEIKSYGAGFQGPHERTINSIRLVFLIERIVFIVFLASLIMVFQICYNL